MKGDRTRVFQIKQLSYLQNKVAKKYYPLVVVNQSKSLRLQFFFLTNLECHPSGAYYFVLTK